MTEDITLTAEEAAELRQDFSYCPRCRTGLEDRQVYGRVRRVCPKCRFIQFIDPKVSAAVMVEKDGRVLLIQRTMDPGQGSWCFPGGFMEIGETPQATAKRECREECGLEVEITKLVDVYYYEDYRGSGVVIMYTGRVAGGKIKTETDEANSIGFFEPGDLPTPIDFDSNLKTLARWINGNL